METAAKVGYFIKIECKNLSPALSEGEGEGE
jgi:hypothetical protein